MNLVQYVGFLTSEPGQKWTPAVLFCLSSVSHIGSPLRFSIVRAGQNANLIFFDLPIIGWNLSFSLCKDKCTIAD